MSIFRTEKRAPSWVQCELCERPASPLRSRLVAARARHDHGPASTGSGALVLLCSDCCALVVEEIDELEWKRRIDERQR